MSTGTRTYLERLRERELTDKLLQVEGALTNSPDRRFPESFKVQEAELKSQELNEVNRLNLEFIEKVYP